MISLRVYILKLKAYWSFHIEFKRGTKGLVILNNIVD